MFKPEEKNTNYRGDRKLFLYMEFYLACQLNFQPFGAVENFVVNEKYRGQGIGTALIKYIFNFGRGNKCFAIKLLSSSFREDAHRFFEKNGFNSMGQDFKIN